MPRNTQCLYLTQNICECECDWLWVWMRGMSVSVSMSTSFWLPRLLDLRMTESKRATAAEPYRSNFLVPKNLNLSLALNHPFEYPKMVASVKHFLALAIFAVLASTGKNLRQKLWSKFINCNTSFLHRLCHPLLSMWFHIERQVRREVWGRFKSPVRLWSPLCTSLSAEHPPQCYWLHEEESRDR